jgi:transposase
MYNKHLSGRKIGAIICCFCEDLTAASASLVGTSRNTVKSYFSEIRQRIFQLSLQESNRNLARLNLMNPTLEQRIRGKRGRGAAGKTPVFGLLQCGGKVFIKVVENCSKESLIASKNNIAQGRILE